MNMKTIEKLKDYDNELIINSMIASYSINKEFNKDDMKSIIISALRDYDHILGDLDDELAIFIIPAVVRCWSNFFIDTPTLIKDDHLKLYKLLFNLEEFLLLVKQKLKITIKFLEDNFNPNIDPEAESLRLIVDSYVSDKVALCRINNPLKEVRKIKIEKLNKSN
jgi:hypothetical protein